MNWENFQDKVIDIIDRQDSDNVEFKAYALSYAENIINAIDEGYSMGVDTKKSVKTQLLYVLSNLDGASRKDLEELCSLANEVDIDISSIVKEILEEANV